MKSYIKRAVDTLNAGGVIAYPTEGVFGLGCLPDNEQAIGRLLHIKQRDANMGLILLASNVHQLRGWVAAEDLLKLPPPVAAVPTTWIARAGDRATPLITGAHAGIAVRITGNRTAAELCRSAHSPITSTSANLSGKSIVRNQWQLRLTFGALVDYIVPGSCGPASGPSEIRDLGTGQVFRAGT